MDWIYQMLSRGNILVVDDEVNLCRILDAKLTRNGYEVITVHDGQQAVEKVRDGAFDLVLLDLILPKLDGVEALSRIRAINSKLPVIVMTACENSEAVNRALSHGISAFLSKPFDLNRLVGLVQSTSGGSHSLQQDGELSEGAGLFRMGQPVSLELPGTGQTFSGDVSGRSASLVTIDLHDPHEGVLRSGVTVRAQIGAPDAMYRFTSVIQEPPGEQFLRLRVPQVMYRVQRRKHPRLEVQAPVMLESDAACSAGTAQDVSAGGMSVLTSQPVSVGEKLTIAVANLLKLREVLCQGEVIRCEAGTAEDEWLLAVRFAEENPEIDRAILHRLNSN